MKQLIEDFGNSIPEAVKTCLSTNATDEFSALGLKYGVTNTTDPSDIEKKIITYVTLHYLTVHGWFGSLNTQWSNGKNYQVGYDAGKYGHTILGLTEESVEESVEKSIEESFAEVFKFQLNQPNSNFFKKNIQALQNLRFW